MAGWENKESITTDVCFNDLARAFTAVILATHAVLKTWRPVKNMKQQAQYPYPHSKNKKNIHVIGQIIDRASGYIQTP